MFTDNQVRIFKNLALPLAAIITDNQKQTEQKMLAAKKWLDKSKFVNIL